MVITRQNELPRGEDWIYEPKLDGYRAVGYVALGRARLISRSGNDFTNRYTTVRDQLPIAFDGHEVVVDGELVGFNEAGREDINELKRKHPQVMLFLFDLLHLDQDSTLHLPQQDRRRILEEVCAPQENVRLVPQFTDPDDLLVAAQQLGLEGIVAKRLSSVYRPGKKTRDWVKLILRDHPERRAWNR